MSRRLRGVVSLWMRAIVLAGICLVQQAGMAQAAGGADAVPFLTTTEFKPKCPDIRHPESWCESWVPTGQRLAFAWSDEPYAIHIPFTAPAGMVGNVQMRLSFQGFEVRAPKKPGDRQMETFYPQLMFQAAGVYRTDGKPFFEEVKGPDGTVRESLSSASIIGVHQWAHRSDQTLIHQSQIAYLNGCLVNTAERRGREASPIEIHTRNLSADTPMVFWFTLNNEAFAKVFFTDKMEANLTVTFLDVSAQDSNSKWTKRAVPPPQTYHLTIRQNGWQATKNVRFIKEKEWTTPDRKDANGRVLGQSRAVEEVAFDGKILSVKYHCASPITRTEYEWTVEPATVIYDHAPHPTSRAHLVVRTNEGSWFDSLQPDLYGSSFTIGRKGIDERVFRCAGGLALGSTDYIKKQPDGSRTRDFVQKQTEGLNGMWYLCGGYSGFENWMKNRRKLGDVPLGIWRFDSQMENWNGIVVLGYCRLSELTDNKLSVLVPRVAEGPAQKSTDDGYWAWKPKFVALQEDGNARIDTIMAQLDKLTREIRAQEADWTQLWLKFHEMPQDKDLFGDDPESGAKGRAYVMGYLYPETLRKNMKDLRAQISAKRADRDKLIQEARSKYAEMLNSVAAQNQRSHGQRQDVAALLEFLQKTQDGLELRLFDAGGLLGTPESLEKITTLESRSDEVGSMARVMRAMWYWERARLDDRKALEGELAMALRAPGELGSQGRWGDAAAFWGLLDPADPRAKPRQNTSAVAARSNRHEALILLRTLVAQEPDNALARSCLCEVELWWIPLFAHKVENERKTTAAAFLAYLKNHDIPTEDPRSPGSWPDHLVENYRYIIGSGPGSIRLAAMDMPGVLGAEVTSVEKESARDQASLRLIKKLLRNGIPMSRIRNIKQNELDQLLHLYSPNGKEIPPHIAWALTQDMKTTFNGMRDLDLFSKATTRPEMMDFEDRFKVAYHLVIDPEQSWGEYFGELGSPRNLAMFGLASPRVTSAISKTLRLDVLGAGLAETRMGACLNASLQNYNLVLQGASRYQRFFAASDRLGAVLVLYCGTAHLADKSNIPGATLLVEALALLNAHELLAGVLFHNGVTPAALKPVVEKVALEAAESKTRATAISTAIADLERLAADMEANQSTGRMITQEQQQKLRSLSDTVRLQAPPAPQRTPSGTVLTRETPTGTLMASPSGTGTVTAGTLIAGNLNAEVAMHDSTNKAITALANGDIAEGRRALNSAKHILTERVVPQAEIKTVTANTALKNLEAAGSVVGTESQSVGRESLVVMGKQTDVKPFKNGQAYATPGYGPLWHTGDEAVCKSNLDEAIESYQRALAAASQSGRFSEVKVLEERLRVLTEAKAKQVEWAALGKPVSEYHPAKPLSDANVKTVDDLLGPRLTDEEARRFGAPRVNTNPPTAGNAGTSQIVTEGRPVTPSTGPGIIPGTPGTKLPEVTHAVHTSRVDVYKFTDAEGNTYGLKVGSADDVAEECWAVGLFNAMKEKSGQATPDIVPVDFGHRAMTLLEPQNVKMDGTVKMKGLLMRWTPGSPLAECAESELVAAKKGWSFQAVFRSLIGDSDGHFGNQLLTKEGRLVPLDFGMGEIKPMVGESAKQSAYWNIESEEHFVDVCLNMTSDPFFEKYSQYRWINRAQEMLSYEHDVAPAIKIIRDFVKEPGPGGARAVLEQRMKMTGSYSEDLLNKCMDALNKRADYLETAWRNRLQNPRAIPHNYNIPRRTSDASEFLRFASPRRLDPILAPVFTRYRHAA